MKVNGDQIKHPAKQIGAHAVAQQLIKMVSLSGQARHHETAS